MLRKSLYALLLGVLVLPASGWGEVIKGRIESISHKARSIAVGVDGQSVVVRFDAKTEFVDVAAAKDLGPKDLIEVTYTPGQPAYRIQWVVFSVPPGQLYKSKDVLSLLQRGGEYSLIDARPKHYFEAGHVPTAASLFMKELKQRMSELPTDKDSLLIFYCGGPTCPFSRASAEIAADAGYTNIKVYNDGMPGWKKAGLPVAASAEWVERHLDPGHIVIDVRAGARNTDAHIPTSVAMPVGRFAELTEQFVRERTPARLPGVADKNAPIILVAETDTGRDVFTAFKALKQWGYKNVAILEGGLRQWREDERKLEDGAGGGVIAYVKVLKKGAVSDKDFIATAFGKQSGVLLDVRSNPEVREGTIFGARHIPLDVLPEHLGDLPKDVPILTYCTNGIRAEMAYKILNDKGFNVAFLNESVRAKPNGTFVLE